MLSQSEYSMRLPVTSSNIMTYDYHNSDYLHWYRLQDPVLGGRQEWAAGSLAAGGAL